MEARLKTTARLVLQYLVQNIDSQITHKEANVCADKSLHILNQDS